MNLKQPINENYAATIVTISNIINLSNCDKVVHTSIFGHMVIVGKDTKIGDKGVFFPVETQLSHEYLYENSLYKNSSLNKYLNEKGYFEENGRIKCVKFRGHKSEGLFMPLSSLSYWVGAVDLAALGLRKDATFDTLNGVTICRKYVIPNNTKNATQGSNKSNKKVAKKVSKIVDGQFRFHENTGMLGKNIFKILPNTIMSITSKFHGTSFVNSRVLCKRKLGWFDRFLKFCGVSLLDYQYETIYSSRKVIKNDDLSKTQKHYYDEDVWKLASKDLEPFMIDGMTIYGEIVGFTPSGKAIQKGYDYGCEEKTYKIYIYRITFTNHVGQFYELSAKKVQQWCNSRGLNAVHEYYYGYAKDFLPIEKDETVESWQNRLLDKLLISYNMEKDCEFCVNSVPAEGLIVRIEDLGYEAYKLKSFRFRTHETEMLDKGEIDIESQEQE